MKHLKNFARLRRASFFDRLRRAARAVQAACRWVARCSRRVKICTFASGAVRRPERIFVEIFFIARIDRSPRALSDGVDRCQFFVKPDFWGTIFEVAASGVGPADSMLHGERGDQCGSTRTEELVHNVEKCWLAGLAGLAIPQRPRY